MNVGAKLSASQVEVALAATAAAGAAHFRTAYSSAAEQSGYFQTMTRSEGTLDLVASRGVAVKEDYPGLAQSTKNESALVGDRLFKSEL